MAEPFFSSQIIAILAAILFPVFARAREKARQTSCLSNLKQIGLGLAMYTQDYDEQLMRYWGNDYEWFEKEMPYVKNQQLFKCPSQGSGWSVVNTTSCASSTHPPESGARNRGNYCSYGMTTIQEGYGEYDGVAGTSNLGYGAGWAEAQVQLPSEKIAACDCPCWRFRGIDHYNNYRAGSISYAPHNEGMNAVFVDGHAKWGKDFKKGNFDMRTTTIYQ